MATNETIYTWATYRNLNLGTSGQVAKAAAGQVGGWFIANQASSVRYVKLYDKAAAPTSSDTPLLTIALPANGAANLLAVAGIDFTAGISLRATTGVADNDTGAPSANDVIINLFYR
jgi:hypothetical protein